MFCVIRAVGLQEGGVNLSLTLVDTPGFGDAVNNSNCWDPVLGYVESQYEAFLDAGIVYIFLMKLNHFDYR
jgi:septin family protein